MTKDSLGIRGTISYKLITHRAASKAIYTTSQQITRLITSPDRTVTVNQVSHEPDE